MFSKVEEAPINLGMPAAGIVSHLKGFFASPAFFDRHVTVVPTQGDLPLSLLGRLQLSDDDYIQGAFDPVTNRVYMVAENIADEKAALAVFLHEVGVHMGMKNLLGTANYDKLVKQVQAWAKAGTGREGELANLALDRVDVAEAADDGPYAQELRDEEMIAYFVEEAVKAGINPTAMSAKPDTLTQWFRTLWAAVKVALHRLGVNPEKLNSRDVVNLAYGAAKMELNGTWHGTAADFKRFDHKFMGSGEGAQAFGWGSYLAQRAGIAYGYWAADVRRKKSGAGKTELKYATGRGVPSEVQHNLAELGVYDMFTKYLRPDWHTVVSAKVAEAEAVVKAHEAADGKAKIAGMFPYVAAKRTLTELKAAVAHGLMLTGGKRPEGQMLRTDVNVQDNEWLDLDVPVSKQSQLVQDALEKVRAHLEANDSLDDYLERYNADWDELSGQEVYKLLEKALEGDALIVESDAVDDALAQGLRDKAASLYLDSLGVKGLRFLDGDSRMVGEGTSNLVVFNDKNIQRIFSQPGASKDARKFSIGTRTAPSSKSIEDKIYGWNAPESVKNAAFVTVSNLKTYGKKTAYYMAMGHDLADLVAGILPSAKTYFNIADAKESVKIHHEAQVDRIVSKAYNVTDKAALNRFLETSTKQAKWGFQPDWMPGTAVEIDAAAAKLFNALTPEAQASAKEIFKHGFESRNELRKLVRAEIEDGFNSENKLASAEEKKSIERRRMKAMRMFDKDLPMMQTPYAPLSRFGNYVMVAKSQLWLDAEANNDQKFLDANRSSGQHYVVSFHDYPGQAALAARNMTAAGWPSADHSPKEVFAQGVTEAPWNAMRRLRTLVDQEYGGTTPGDRKAAESARKHINQMLSDLYLATLSETSARKHNLKRANVEGSSDDMLRAFASKGKADAHFIAALAKNGEITDALAAMRKQAGERGATRDDRKLALNEILSRHALGLAYQETPIQDRLMQFNSVWTLLTKPSYYFQNATQPWMMSLPVIARHKDVGMRKAASALTEAYSQLAPAFGKDGIVKGMLKGEFDIDALPVSKDEKKMLNALRDLGILDVGINRDMGYWESRGGMAQPLTDALHKMNGWVKQVETVNRVSTALAAYRVVGGGQKGIDEATHVIRTTHGNYSGSNAPRLWSIPGARTILQFRKFQFIQASLMIRLFANTKFGSKEEKAAAWAALRWTFGHFAIMTGATGLPAMALVGTMLAAAGGDDDEPADFDKMVREAIGDKTLADLILKGAPSLIGLDMTGMLGAQNMLSILPYTDVDMNDRTGYAKTMMGLSGSFWGGTMSNMADGVGLIQQGDLYKGFEKMLPSGLSKAANAWRMASDGYTNRNGDLLMDSDELTGLVALAQGMGLRTTKVADMQAATGRTIEFDRFYRERASEITHRYVKAYRSGDAGELTKQRQAYMDLQASKRANGLKAQPLSNLLKAPRDQMKRERNTVGGVQFNRNNREFVEDAVAEN